ncbi:MAG TPA: hypothetical protein VIM75_17215 [Ohtaekwangia sp.]|uniref:hypothetical protein n=1 Tax=Ohtaekwangia sp. TaxID=2066019 RepID=UPI002F959395
MATKRKLIDEMNQIRDYFRRHSENDPLFIPQYQIAKQINDIVNDCDRLEIAEVKEIIRIFNTIIDTNYDNRSGWTDYQMHLTAVMKMDGFRTDWDNLGRFVINVGEQKI